MATNTDHDDPRSASMATMVGPEVGIDFDLLGEELMEMISSAAHVARVEIGDLRIFGDPSKNDGKGGVAAPNDVLDAMMWGTKFFDARFYFMLDVTRRPPVQKGTRLKDPPAAVVALVGRRLSWMAMFMMLRGSYPSTEANAVGTNVPKFLKDIFSAELSPKGVADSLASFPLNKIKPDWIKTIDWSKAGPEFGQRLGLAVAGYRILGMFKIYDHKVNADSTEKAAHRWIKALAQHPVDYDIMSITRSPTLIAKLGPWNKNLYSAVFHIFSSQDIQEAIDRKIIPVQARLDTGVENWKTWSSITIDFLNSPVKLAKTSEND